MHFKTACRSEARVYKYMLFFLQRVALQGIGSAAVHSGNIASGGEGRGFGASQSPVLRIIVENLFYPVTLEVLQQVRQHCLHPGLILFIVGLFLPQGH